MTKPSTSPVTGAAPSRRSTRSTPQLLAADPTPADTGAQVLSNPAQPPVPPSAPDRAATPPPAAQPEPSRAPGLPAPVDLAHSPSAGNAEAIEVQPAHPTLYTALEEGEIAPQTAADGMSADTAAQPGQSSDKGKNKEVTARGPVAQPVAAQPRDEDDAELQRELELAKFRSLQPIVSRSGDSSGASTSSAAPRRAEEVPPASPSKRQRTNTAGDANTIRSSTSAPAPSPRIPRLVFDTADGRAPRNGATPAPTDGWPIHSYSIENLFAAIPDDQLTQWRQHREIHGTGVLAYLSGAGGDPANAVANLRAAIAGQINVDADEIDIGSPTAAASGPVPFVFFVAGSGLTSRLETAITHTVINVANVSASILPIDSIPSGYIGAFRGNHYADSPRGLETARRDIAANIFGHELIAQHIRDHHEAFGDDHSLEEAVKQAAESAVVRSLVLETANGPQTIYRVWIAPHTHDRREWAYFEALVGCVRIQTTVNGTGTIIRPMQCRICPGVDHPTGLCALPMVPGWRGPTAESVGALEDAARDAIRRMREDMRAADTRVQAALANLQGGGRLNYKGQSFSNSGGGSRGGRGRGNGRGGRGGSGAKRGDRKGKGRDYDGGW